MIYTAKNLIEFQVNGEHQNNDSTVIFGLNKPTVHIECYYDFVLRDMNPNMNPRIFLPDHLAALKVSEMRDPSSNDYILGYYVPDSEKSDHHVYRCGSISNDLYMVVVTLVYSVPGTCEFILNILLCSIFGPRWWWGRKVVRRIFFCMQNQTIN